MLVSVPLQLDTLAGRPPAPDLRAALGPDELWGDATSKSSERRKRRFNHELNRSR